MGRDTRHIGGYSIKKKKGGREFAPAPDTLLQKAMAERETNAYDDATADGRSGAVGLETRSVSDSRNDLTAVGEGRSSVLGLKLDAMGGSVAGQTVVDPKALTGLSSVKVSSTSDIADVKKARLLLKSVIGTNPRHAPGWIAAARLEDRREDERRAEFSRSAGAARVSRGARTQSRIENAAV